MIGWLPALGNVKVERETGIEPVTSSLGSWRSTAELLPLTTVAEPRLPPIQGQLQCRMILKHAEITANWQRQTCPLRRAMCDRLRTAHGKNPEHKLGASPYPLPSLGVHKGARREISRCSHTRAVVHSRTTVAGEIPRTSEVSSMVRPAKKRNSTIRLCCGSSLARS